MRCSIFSDVALAYRLKQSWQQLKRKAPQSRSAVQPSNVALSIDCEKSSILVRDNYADKNNAHTRDSAVIFSARSTSSDFRACACILPARLFLAEIRDYSQTMFGNTTLNENATKFKQSLLPLFLQFRSTATGIWR